MSPLLSIVRKDVKMPMYEWSPGLKSLENGVLAVSLLYIRVTNDVSGRVDLDTRSLTCEVMFVSRELGLGV